MGNVCACQCACEFVCGVPPSCAGCALDPGPCVRPSLSRCLRVLPLCHGEHPRWLGPEAGEAGASVSGLSPGWPRTQAYATPVSYCSPIRAAVLPWAGWGAGGWEYLAHAPPVCPHAQVRLGSPRIPKVPRSSPTPVLSLLSHQHHGGGDIARWPGPLVPPPAGWAARLPEAFQPGHSFGSGLSVGPEPCRGWKTLQEERGRDRVPACI